MKSFSLTFASLTILGSIALFALQGCGSGEPNSDLLKTTPPQRQQPRIVDGVMDLGAADALVTDILNESRNNFVHSSHLQNVHTVKADFRFNSGSHSAFFIDPDLGLRNCQGTQPFVTWSLQNLQGDRTVQARTEVPVTLHTDYVLHVHVESLHCEEFSVVFGLRHEGAGD
ncbi:MAG: hypothetical protein H7222_06225 [Methylotenera sp.]|nr:hypothetical protein [Oligoflexia bacterium]